MNRVETCMPKNVWGNTEILPIKIKRNIKYG